MSTRTEKNTLKRMSKDRSFRIERRGDSQYGVAEGFRPKQLMLRGERTPAGIYLTNKGVHISTDAINRTVRTYFRGNSEYTYTQTGNVVRLRNSDGSLTERGKQMYTNPEITVEVPALQVGTNKLNEQYRIPTYKVFTENEYPEIGEVFRGTPGSDADRFQAVKQSLTDTLQDGDLLMEESAQVWIFDPSRKFIFRVRRMVGNELKVEKMELNHSVPLQYDFLRISNMLPEALEYGGKCVPRQCEVLLKRNCDDDFRRLWQRQSDAPWDGRVTTEMLQEFCAQNNINLMAFHGNRKVVQQTATSDVWLTYFFWDDHAYFVTNSRPYVQTPLSLGPKGSKVEMDRDLGTKITEPGFWTGEVKAGVFLPMIWLTFAKSGLTKALYLVPIAEGIINLIQLLAAHQRVIASSSNALNFMQTSKP